MKYEELDEERRLLVLRWAQEAIDMGMKKQIQTRAYAAFVECLNGKRETYEMEQIWKELPESTRNHFQHASGILLDIEAEIDEIEDDLLDDENNDAETLDPFIDVSNAEKVENHNEIRKE